MNKSTAKEHLLILIKPPNRQGQKCKKPTHLTSSKYDKKRTSEFSRIANSGSCIALLMNQLMTCFRI
jgi:hypothetical protein